MPAGGAEAEVDSADVVRLLLQFCQEQGLSRSFDALRDETRVSLNTVPNLDAFQSDILQGNWDAVLRAVGHMSLPTPKLYDLYDQVVVEMAELRETDLARRLMQDVEVLRAMQSAQAERYARLESLVAKTYFDARDAYPDGSTRERRRAALAASLAAEVSVVPPGRLLSLLSQALKWQQHQHGLPAGERIDVFKGGVRRPGDAFDTHPSQLHRTIKFGSKSHPECARFSPDGSYLVTGSVDGFVEVWDYETARVCKELEYQRNDEFMMHEQAVISAAFSPDSEQLATGSQEGMVKVWRVASGQCVRKLERAHTQGVTALCFSRDAAQLLSGSFDATARAHGLKSGKVLREFRGHKSFVNDVCFSADASRVLTGSSDGVVKIWDARSMDCLCDVVPPVSVVGLEPVVNSITPVPNTVDRFVVCTKSPSIHIISLAGKVLKTMHSGKRVGGAFVAAAVSPKGEWVYAAGEDRILYCFHVSSGRLEHTLKLSEQDVIGLTHHPSRNYVASYGVEGALKLWAPE